MKKSIIEFSKGKKEKMEEIWLSPMIKNAIPTDKNIVTTQKRQENVQ